MKRGQWIQSKNSNHNIINILIIVVAILGLSLIVFHRYIFGGDFLLHSDLLRANLPTYYHMYDNLFLGEGGFWSWRMGIGTSMFSHGDTYFDPFVYIVFLRGREYIPSMMIWVLVVKLIFEGIAFYFYINYFKINRFSKILGAVLYAFSGYSLITGNNFALGTVLVYLPLVFLGIEHWLSNNKKSLLVIALFLIGIDYLYFFYISGILAFIYLVFRVVQTGKKEQLFKYIVGLIGIGVVTTLLSAPSLLPQLELMMQSSRTGSNSDQSFGWLLFMPNIGSAFSILVRIFGLNFFNSGELGYIGKTYIYNDSLDTATYSSIFFYILLFQWYYYDKKNRKNILYVCSIIIIFSVFPFFSYLMNAFSTINMRWLCVMSLLGSIVMAMGTNAIIENKQLNLKYFFASIITYIILLLFSIEVLTFDRGGDYISIFSDLFITGRYYYVSFFVLIMIAIIMVAIQRLISKKIITLVFLLCFCIDIYSNYKYLYDNDIYINSYTEENGACYMDTSAQIIESLMTEDRGFYRINKDFDSVTCYVPVESCNDAMAQRYYGLKNYNSLNNASYQDFLIKSNIYPEGIKGQALNYIYGVGNNYDLMSYLGVKYYLSKENDVELPDNFEHINKVGDINVFYNREAYPLAFVNSNRVSLKQYESLDCDMKNLALLTSVIIDEDINDMNLDAMKDVNIQEYAQERNEAFTLNSFYSDRIDFNIVVKDDDSILSLTMPYDKGWNIFIDGEKVESIKVNISLLGAYINSGNHNVELVYTPSAFKVGLILSCVGIILIVIILIFYNIHSNSGRE